MKLIDLKCSQCGAVFQVSDDLKHCTCNYCGNKMLIDDEIQRTEHKITGGYEFGYGLIKGQADAYEEQVKKLKREKFKRRFIFIVLELSSFFFALGTCYIVAIILDTNTFKENNWLIFAIWGIIAYSIYQKFKYLIK